MRSNCNCAFLQRTMNTTALERRDSLLLTLNNLTLSFTSWFHIEQFGSLANKTGFGLKFHKKSIREE